MDGWEIDRHRLRELRERSSTRAVDMARRAGCHERHYARIETDAEYGRHVQPSAELAHAICRVLTEAVGREITLDDIAHRVESRRKSVA